MTREGTRRSCVVLVLSGALALSACADESGTASGAGADGDAAAPGGAAPDARATGGAGAGGTSGAAGERGAGGASLPPVTCGTVTCEPPDRSTGLQAFACCTTEDACGLRVPISQECLAFRQPGHLDPACPPYEQAQLSLRGCCSPAGCGAWATFQNVGCVPNDALGRGAIACNYDRLSADASALPPADAAAGD